MTPKEVNQMGLINELGIIIDEAKAKKEWVVIVCPDAEVVSSCKRTLAGLIPGDAKFSGRTAVLNGSGKVSVVTATEDVFIEEPFAVSFIGWRSTDGNDGMLKWQQKAKRTIKSETY